VVSSFSWRALNFYQVWRNGSTDAFVRSRSRTASERDYPTEGKAKEEGGDTQHTHRVGGEISPLVPAVTRAVTTTSALLEAAAGGTTVCFFVHFLFWKNCHLHQTNWILWSVSLCCTELNNWHLFQMKMLKYLFLVGYLNYLSLLWPRHWRHRSWTSG